MKRFIFIPLVCALGLLADEQNGSLYLIKVNGDTLFGASKIKEKVFSPNLVLINGDSLELNFVSVIKNETGFFRLADEIGSEKLAMRKFDGKVIDKYSIESVGMYMAAAGSSSMPGSIGGLGGMGGGAYSRVDLYSKLDGPLKKIDYDNVKKDFWDRPDSREMIETYEKKRFKMYVGLAVSVISLFASAPLADDHKNIAAVCSITFLVSGIYSYYNYYTKEKYLYKAVERYEE